VTITTVWPSSSTERRRNPSSSALDRESRFVEPAQVDAGELDLAVVEGVQAGQAVQQGGLARGGGAHHGGEAAAAEGDRDPVQGGDRGRPPAVGLGDLDAWAARSIVLPAGRTVWLADMAAPGC
jgi:hypothetical protein